MNDKYISLDIEGLGIHPLAEALIVYEVLCLKHGASRIHDSYFMSHEQAIKIIEEFNNIYPQFKDYIEMRIVE